MAGPSKLHLIAMRVRLPILRGYLIRAEHLGLGL